MKKGVFWSTKPRVLTWHAGPPHGCDAGWGHVAELWVAHARRRRHTRRNHVAGGHATTRVHMGARVGCHVAGGDDNWRAHGYSGALVREGGGNAIKVTFAPSYLTMLFPNLFSVWDYVPTRSYLLQVTWTHGGRWIQSEWQRSRGPESTRSSNQHVRLNQV